MESLSINQQLSSGDLFLLFKQQLGKDFSGAGLNSGFIEGLPPSHPIIRHALITELSPLSADKLAALLYRVDVPEKQLKQFAAENPALDFPAVVAELTILRILQKVMIRSAFRKRH